MLIDANIFLEFLLKQEKSDRCKVILNKLLSGEISATVSTFTIDSVLLSMHRNGCSVGEMHAFMLRVLRSKGIRLYVLSIKDRVEAIRHIERHEVDYEDALVLQSAISTQCTKILSFDGDFNGIEGLDRIEP